MHELGTELGRFMGGIIDDTQLHAAFSEHLTRHPDQRPAVADWLKESVQSGRLSSSVWVSLSDLFEAPPAAPSGHDAETRLTSIHGVANPRRPPAKAQAKQPDPEDIPQGPTERHAREPEGSSLRPGMVIRERFVLMEELGSGGMGKVFKARDLRREEAMDRNPYIALKILNAEMRAHPDSFMALQREARRAGQLAHPNVVTVYDFDRDGDRIFMTMEYLEGRPLDSYLRDEYAAGLPFADAWPIISAIGEALEFGHRKRIVHSDLKPGNIFVCSDGTVKVLDFGISRLIRPAGADRDVTIFDPGQRLGGLTPAYASLEMWTQDTPDPRDDIYAFACVCYELLTGQHPFGRASAREVRDNGLAPERIDSIKRGQWESIRKGLALHREQRTATVRELLSELESRSLWQRHAFALTVGAIVAAISAVIVGSQFFRAAVESDTMEVLQCAQAIKPVAPASSGFVVELTPERQQEISDNVLLATDYLADARSDTPVDALKAMLSDGPNSVNDILNSVLAVDPKQPEALKLKKEVADIYATRARESLAKQRTTEALDLVRYGRNVLPSSQELFRLEQTICRADAVARNAKG